MNNIDNKWNVYITYKKNYNKALFPQYFSLDDIRKIESITSIANGYIGMRGNFEEDFTGDTHQGFYIGGVWYPDKTRVGWWKNGYPEYFGKAINCFNINPLHIYINDKLIDLYQYPINNLTICLDLKNGILKRQFSCNINDINIIVDCEKFISFAKKELLALKYSIRSDKECNIKIISYIDNNVRNIDSNYDEYFWEQLIEKNNKNISIISRTKKTKFNVESFTCCAVSNSYCKDLELKKSTIKKGYVDQEYIGTLSANTTLDFYKFANIHTSRDKNLEALKQKCENSLLNVNDLYYIEQKNKHIKKVNSLWEKSDIEIDGDDKLQLAIRFNLFQLFSTYSGDDPALNIGPKGFTGEKYGGATYWDTEAYCFPVYLATKGQEVAKQLLEYRYNQLDKAYINAKNQCCQGALYPMVTFNGLECHNEWEITFEEIHRNAAIAYAIFYYTQFTGDKSYILEKGYEVLFGIAKFYANRVHYNKNKDCYMIHGVTGPNEYENNINNNWYTNRMASWAIDYFVSIYPLLSKDKQISLGITEQELQKYRTIVSKMYYPEDKNLNIFVQHDTFLDKELKTVDKIPENERPINQNWSWDKILRSCYIKQADVLQGLYFLNHLYDIKTIKSNFDFYEPMTVHESSLSPCVHSILASQLGYLSKAYKFLYQTARLDLDNLNNDTEDGLHITSMAGSWLSIVHGFAGMRTNNGMLCFNPKLPQELNYYKFKITYKNRLLELYKDKESVEIKLLKGKPLSLYICNKKYILDTNLKIKKDS